jgi:hypothetical protein
VKGVMLNLFQHLKENFLKAFAEHHPVDPETSSG